MNRFTIAAGLGAAGVLAVAGCGSAGSGATSSSAATPAGAATVSVRQLAGTGRVHVLVDSSGRTLYSPDQEVGGHVMCVGGCTSIWMPLTVKGKPTAAAGVGAVASVRRADGTLQVTVKGKPAYTFVQDRPGKATGQGAQDAFGGRRFTWHVLTAAGAGAATPAPPAQQPSSRTNYGY